MTIDKQNEINSKEGKPMPGSEDQPVPILLPLRLVARIHGALNGRSDFAHAIRTALEEWLHSQLQEPVSPQGTCDYCGVFGLIFAVRDKVS